MMRIQFTLLLLFFTTSLFAQNLDINILKAINGPVNNGADKTWEFISKKAILIDEAVPASLLIAGFINHDDELKMSGVKATAALIVAGGTTFILKRAINRARPFVTYPDDITPKGIPTDPSFPSGHTSFAFAAATSMSLAIPKWYVIAPSFAYASAVGYSRMYLGVHYPSDVLFGALIGSGSAFLTWKAQKWLSKKKHKKDFSNNFQSQY